MTHGRNRRGENSKYITIWDRPNCAFPCCVATATTLTPTEYGYVTYRQWCEYEIARMAKEKIIVYIVPHPDGKREICLSL